MLLADTCAPTGFSLKLLEKNLAPLALWQAPNCQPSVILYCNNCRKRSLKTGCLSRGSGGLGELKVIVWCFLGALCLLLAGVTFYVGSSTTSKIERQVSKKKSQKKSLASNW